MSGRNKNWINFVRNWASNHKTTYGCALSNSKCKAEYHDMKQNFPDSFASMPKLKSAKEKKAEANREKKRIKTKKV